MKRICKRGHDTSFPEARDKKKACRVCRQLWAASFRKTSEGLKIMQAYNEKRRQNKELDTLKINITYSEKNIRRNQKRITELEELLQTQIERLTELINAEEN